MYHYITPLLQKKPKEYYIARRNKQLRKRQFRTNRGKIKKFKGIHKLDPAEYESYSLIPNYKAR